MLGCSLVVLLSNLSVSTWVGIGSISLKWQFKKFSSCGVSWADDLLFAGKVLKKIKK